MSDQLLNRVILVAVGRYDEALIIAHALADANPGDYTLRYWAALFEFLVGDVSKVDEALYFENHICGSLGLFVDMCFDATIPGKAVQQLGFHPLYREDDMRLGLEVLYEPSVPT